MNAPSAYPKPRAPAGVLAALALLAGAVHATGVVPGHDTGWTTESQCTSAEALAQGHIHRCWSITEAWLAVEGESPHHAADVHYTCEPPADDTARFERLYFSTRAKKVNMRTGQPLALTVRWDDETETHELPVRVVVEKVKGKFNQRKFWYWVDAEAARGAPRAPRRPRPGPHSLALRAAAGAAVVGHREPRQRHRGDRRRDEGLRHRALLARTAARGVALSRRSPREAPLPSWPAAHPDAGAATATPAWCAPRAPAGRASPRVFARTPFALQGR